MREGYRCRGLSPSPSANKPLEVPAVETYTILGLMAIGFIPGFYLGRWYAETFRAMFDRRRIWENRDLYRRR